MQYSTHGWIIPYAERTTLGCRSVCSSRSTGVRIRASLWSQRVPMIYFNQEIMLAGTHCSAWVGTLD